jgi:predicted nucleic acid-binding protein
VRYLLDTNVLSEPARPVPDARVVAWLEARVPLECALSVLTLGEIQKGVSLMPEGRRRDHLGEWLATELPRQFAGRILAIDERVTMAWGRLMAEGRRAGREPPVIDGLLLATAEVHGLTFVTRNERDCTDRGIPILNPWTTVE